MTCSKQKMVVRFIVNEKNINLNLALVHIFLKKMLNSDKLPVKDKITKSRSMQYLHDLGIGSSLLNTT